MSDFSEIYVDLANITPAPTAILDSNGAVICDGVTQWGTSSNQLTYDEFNTYLAYRCTGRDVVFKFKNKIDVASLVTSNRFLSVSTNSTITMTSQDQLESYKFTISDTDEYIGFNISNSNLVIDNMDFELQNKGIIHIVGPKGNIDSTVNNITINNSRFWLEEPIQISTNQGGSTAVISQASVVIERIKSIKCYNSTFNNKDASKTSSAIVVAQPWEGYDGVSGGLGATFIGCVFVRIYNMYELTQQYSVPYSEVLAWNTFTGVERGFRDSTFDGNTQGYRLVNFVSKSDLAGPYHNQYGWSTIPTVCDASLYTATQSDFNYLDADWDTLDNTFITSTEFEDSRTWYSDITVYGQRDGKGPLVFTPMDDPIIQMSSSIAVIGDVITLQNADPVYDTSYDPFRYIWRAKGSPIGTTPVVNYTVDMYGSIPIIMTIESHNRLYDVGASSVISSKVDKADIILDIKTYDALGVEKDTFTVGEPVTTTITNNTTGDPVVGTVEVNINGVSFDTQELTNYLDSISTNDTFRTISEETIFVTANTVDGGFEVFSKPITITDIVATDTYYVDLDVTYSDAKWLELKNGIYDNFENGSISSGFNSQFRTNYDVEFMYDEYVANGTLKSNMISGIGFGEFYVEGSFVRDSLDDIPHICVVLDSVEISIEWDYISDRINIYNGGKKISYKYGEFVKDLSCPNALHKLGFKFIYTITDETLSIQYNLDGETWLDYPFTLNMTFISAVVNILGTEDTGLGYIGIQADEVIDGEWGGDSNGGEAFPFTYEEMYDRIKLDNARDTDGIDGAGAYYDNYLCRNSRVVTQDIFKVDRKKNFSINVWNPHKYGPWMLVFANMTTTISFVGMTLSNGIIYDLAGTSELLITNTYDMFITWNSTLPLGFIRYTTRYTGEDFRSDIIGSTIKSNSGFYTNFIDEGVV